MDKWGKAIDFVLAYEGSYVNDPNDAGGETNWGISKRAYPSIDIKALTKDQAVEIYRKDYFEAVHGDELPEGLAIAVFDCAVNQGVLTACRLLQVALGVKVDGIVGPQTIGAAFKQGQKGLVLFLMQRAKRYMQTTGVQTWGANWGERLVRLTSLVVEEDDKTAWPSR